MQLNTVYSKYGVDPGRLLRWLIEPRQGISPQVAATIIKEVALEFVEGKEWFREPLMYSPNYRRFMEEKIAKDNFWVDNYVLERCRWAMEDAEVQEYGGRGNTQEVLEMLTSKIAEGFSLLQNKIIVLETNITILRQEIKSKKSFWSKLWRLMRLQS